MLNKNCLLQQRGATMVEYAFMVALIAIVVFLSVSFIGLETKKPFSSVDSSLTSSAQAG